MTKVIFSFLLFVMLTTAGYSAEPSQASKSFDALPANASQQAVAMVCGQLQRNGTLPKEYNRRCAGAYISLAKVRLHDGQKEIALTLMKSAQALGGNGIQVAALASQLEPYVISKTAQALAEQAAAKLSTEGDVSTVAILLLILSVVLLGRVHSLFSFFLSNIGLALVVITGYSLSPGFFLLVLALLSSSVLSQPAAAMNVNPYYLKVVDIIRYFTYLFGLAYLARIAVLIFHQIF